MPDMPPETIVVRAITPAAGAEAFGAIRLDSQDLSATSGRVEDALRDLGGVQLFRASSTRSSNPTADGITARGLSGNAASRMLVTLDGVPLADPFFGFVAWGNLIGRPLAGGELVRGGGLGGPGALAGSLALETGDIGNAAALRYGSRDSLEGSASLALPVGAGSFGLFGGYSRGDGQYLVGQPGPGDVQARYRQWSVGGRASAVSGDWRIEGGVSAFDDQRLRGVEGADIASSGGDANLRARSSGPWRADIAVYGQVRDFSTVNRTLDATRTVATTNLDQQKTPASGWGLRASVEPPLGQQAALSIGAEWRAVEGRTIELFRYVSGEATRRRVAGGEQQTGGLFFDGSWRAAPELLLTAAGRIDRWHIGDGTLEETDRASGNVVLDDPSEARSGTEASGRLGLSWRPAPAIRLRAAGYRGWRLPTLNELYRPFRAGADATAANPDLEPERLWGGEASVAFEPLTNASLSATWFYNSLENPITNVTLGQGPGNFPGVGFVAAGGFYRQRQNLDRILSHGLEADARLSLGATRIAASMALVDAEMRGGGLDGLRPAQAPRFSASLSVAHSIAGVEGAVTLRHLGERYEDDRNTRPLPAATTLDASLAVPLAHGLQLQLAAENLTDAEVASGYSGSQYERGQPRTLWIGLRAAL